MFFAILDLEKEGLVSH